MQFIEHLLCRRNHTKIEPLNSIITLKSHNDPMKQELSLLSFSRGINQELM